MHPATGGDLLRAWRAVVLAVGVANGDRGRPGQVRLDGVSSVVAALSHVAQVRVELRLLHRRNRPEVLVRLLGPLPALLRQYTKTLSVRHWVDGRRAGRGQTLLRGIRLCETLQEGQ